MDRMVLEVVVARNHPVILSSCHPVILSSCLRWKMSFLSWISASGLSSDQLMDAESCA
jgi:hypothetical protein